MLQEVLLQLSRKLGLLREPQWFRAWAWRVATREALRFARRRQRRADLLTSTDAIDRYAATVLEEDPRIDEVLAALDHVSPASAIVLRMHYVDGLRHVEIAEALSLSIGTVKSRLAYGLATVRARLARDSAT